MTKLVLFLVIIAVVSYFAGGLNGAIIASMTVHRKDVRNYGSGNAGLTNFNRTFGTKGIVIVLGVDILKAVLANVVGGLLLGSLGYFTIGRLFATFCVMMGHVYPPYYKLRGGKGVLCAGTSLWFIDWRVGLVCWTVFLVAVVFTRYVSLGSMLGAACVPIALLCFGFSGLECVLGLLIAVLVIWAHRENIRKLAHGTESKLAIGGSGRNT